MDKVKTHEDNVITSGEDLNDHQGDHVFLMLVDNGHDITVVGCETIYDIAFYTSKLKLLKDSVVDSDGWMLLRARILDPEDLPYEIEYGTCVLVIFEDGLLFRGDTICEATKHIEDLFQNWASYIDDFAVVSGREVPDSVKTYLKNKIDAFDKLLAQGGQEVDEDLSDSG